MDFSDAQSWLRTAANLPAQQEGFALRALASMAQECVSESLLPAIAPGDIQDAGANLVGYSLDYGLDSSHAGLAHSSFA
jgi:hypothetical protein